MANDAERFRQALPAALELWVAEELISREQAAAIGTYYRQDEAPARRFADALRMAVGPIAGLGLIALGAANYALVPVDVRLAIALAVLVGAALTGFRLLDDPARARWGHVALTVAAFALGAAAATIAQRWQIGGAGGEIWGVWALGCLGMAWAAQAGGVAGVAALALVGFAFTADTDLACLAPWAFLLGVAPLGYKLDSRPLLYAGLLGAWLAMTPICPDAAGRLVVELAAVAGVLGWQVWHVRRLPFQRLERAVIRREPGDALFALSEAASVRHGALVYGVVLAALGGLMAGDEALVAGAAGASWPVALTLAAWVLGGFGACLAMARHAQAPLAHAVAGLGMAAAAYAVAASLPGAWQLATFVVVGLAGALAIADEGLRTGDRRFFWIGVVATSWGVCGCFLLASEGEPLVLGAGMVAGAAVVAAASWLLDRRGRESVSPA